MSAQTSYCARAHETEAFFQSLVVQSLDHRAVQHPYLKALADGTVPNLEWALRDFAKQYFGYSTHFTRYLTLVISRLDSAVHRQALMENLLEENGRLGAEELDALASIGIQENWVQGIPHSELFRRFQISIGAEPFTDADEESIEVLCWRESFLSLLATGTPAEAIGAIGFGTEHIVSHIYKYFVRSIRRYGRLQSQDYVFFTLHTLIDDDHGKTLVGIAKDLCIDSNARYELRKGMRKALNMRVLFWDWMYERAMTPQGFSR